MPGSISVASLEQKHPDWTELHQFWEAISLLYRGGWALKQKASLFLEARPQEPGQVYSKRLAGFTHQNILSSGLGFYISNFSKNEAQIFLRTDKAKSGLKRLLPGFLSTSADPAQDPAFSTFLNDADRQGTRLVDMVKKWFESAALYNVAYTLIDLPASDGALNLRQQKESGALTPYLTNFDPIQVINWGDDRYGNLDWILIATDERQQAIGETAVITDRWYYFDKTDFRVYESRRDDGAKQVQTRTANIVSEGLHALSGIKVPVRRMSLPEGLQLAYRVYPQVLDHLNQDNAVKWGLTMACLPVPVIAGEYEDPPVVSETAYIKLAQGGTFTYAEPSGVSFRIAAERVQELRQEIYRQMYLQALGRSSSATAAASSGYSKEMEMAPSADVANEFGAIFRSALRGILQDFSTIQGRPDVSVEIQGLEFSERDELADITSAEAALAADVPSDSFEKFVLKKLVHAYARGVDDATLKTFDQEIDQAPTKSQRDDLQRQQQQQQFASALDSSIAKLGVKEAA